MSDLIDRQAAIDALRDWEMCYDWDEHCREEPKEPWVVSPSDVVNKLPPIQPEIVRCKDCKYAEYIDDVQTLWCTECGQGRTVAPNDFCSYAERREVTT